MILVFCEYCGDEAKFVTGREIYPHRPDLHDKKFWRCWPCRAYVGCHEGTRNPLGRLANRTLRCAKITAHGGFDPLWLDAPRHQRRQHREAAYKWLAKELGIEREDCHIGNFDLDTIMRMIQLCETRRAAEIASNGN